MTPAEKGDGERAPPLSPSCFTCFALRKLFRSHSFRHRRQVLDRKSSFGRGCSPSTLPILRSAFEASGAVFGAPWSRPAPPAAIGATGARAEARIHGVDAQTLSLSALRSHGDRGSESCPLAKAVRSWGHRYRPGALGGRVQTRSCGQARGQSLVASRRVRSGLGMDLAAPVGRGDPSRDALRICAGLSRVMVPETGRQAGCRDADRPGSVLVPRWKPGGSRRRRGRAGSMMGNPCFFRRTRVPPSGIAPQRDRIRAHLFETPRRRQ